MSDHDSSHDDRRLHPRWPMTKAVKVRCGLTGHYLPGQSLDASWTGLRIRLANDATLKIGQPISITLPSESQQGLLRADAMVPATVARIDATGAFGIHLGTPESALIAA